VNFETAHGKMRKTNTMAEAQKVDGPLQADKRLLSLDALRGFDMFWIIGGKEIALAAASLTGWGWLKWLSNQLEHAEWHGFTLYDLIFPLFLFMAGVAMPFSFAKRIELGATKAQLYRHVFMRALMLVFLGMIYNDLLKFDWATMRYTSVLGHIGIAYFFAALIVLNSNAIGQFIWAVVLLVAYWAMMKFIPVPGYGAGDLSPAHTLNDYLDRLLMPGQLKYGDRDPLGILATIPAIGTALAGAIAGHLIKSDRHGGYFKTLAMAIAGVICFVLAYLWSFNFPINKNLWSSSFVLHCAGYSLLLLALFYLVIDIWRFRNWAMVFVVIGSNSILIYMARRCVDFEFTTHFFFDGLIGTTGPYQPLLFAVAVVIVQWLLLLLLYKRRIFLKV
jgi:predicted acyltransferase